MKTIAVIASALGLCAWGCANHSVDQVPAVLPYVEVHQRATNEFAEAAFFKPAEPKTNDLTSSLAPLILQEVKGGKAPLSRLERFATLSLSNGVLALDRSRPAIYWQADSVQFKGKAHVRLSYLWCYALAPAGQSSVPPGLPWQGIRVTLNLAGQPVIWEVLADGSGAELIYISRNLEAAAVAEFGKPLPGRRYAIERSRAEAPNAIVARIIDDGPVAMGPIIYLNAGTREVTTLICRCMPAQAKRLLETRVYDLLPFQPTAAQTAFWPGDQPGSSRLEKCLRLPTAF